ncbi:SHOCT domain-containing protein [Schleiferilactobacillus perolens]|nr:SHOCT domain-containing protein [Schleiferilactobacillus perolens]
MRRGTNSGWLGGCGTIFILMMVLALAIQYWYIIAAIVLIAGGAWWYISRQKAHAVEQAAQEQRAAQQEQTTIAKIKDYKQLLDDGAITPEEYDRKKRELLGDNWDNF